MCVWGKYARFAVAFSLSLSFVLTPTPTCRAVHEISNQLRPVEMKCGYLSLDVFSQRGVTVFHHNTCAIAAEYEEFIRRAA